MCVSSQPDIGEHLSSMLLGDRERCLAVMVFSAYLDEAGTHRGCPCVSVAGFYGDADQWAAFRELWKPHSSGFHATDSDRKFPELCNAIEKSQISGMFMTIWKADYDRMATEQVKSRLGNCYALCAFECVLGICDETKAPTAFVLEQGQPNFPFVMNLLLYMLDANTTCMSSVTPANKADFIELHAADFISHCASTWDKPWLQRLLDAHRLKHGHIGEKQLDGVGPELKALISKARREREEAKRER